jgi:hypothetical protein
VAVGEPRVPVICCAAKGITPIEAATAASITFEAQGVKFMYFSSQEVLDSIRSGQWEAQPHDD